MPTTERVVIVTSCRVPSMSIRSARRSRVRDPARPQFLAADRIEAATVPPLSSPMWTMIPSLILIGDIAVPQNSFEVSTREEKSLRQSSAPVDAFHAERIAVVPSV